MKRTPHHILVCASVHLDSTNGKPRRSSELEQGAGKQGAPDPGPALSSSAQSAHAPSPDWFAAWPNALDEDAIDELAEALRPSRHTLA
ncbi:MAG: hypothetical protein ABSF35_19630 [Polyangia bacterium]|jgi:hypothetical protein